MKKRAPIVPIIFLLATLFTSAQSENTTGALNATTVKTMNYEKNGSKMPYKVKIQEQRFYKASFDRNKKNTENWNRTNKPTEVTKVITIKSDYEKGIDRVLVLRYQKGLTDTFALTATEKGFVVKVSDKTIHYAIGEGISFKTQSDRDFFIVEEFDMIL